VGGTPATPDTGRSPDRVRIGRQGPDSLSAPTAYGLAADDRGIRRTGQDGSAPAWLDLLPPARLGLSNGHPTDLRFSDSTRIGYALATGRNRRGERDPNGRTWLHFPKPSDSAFRVSGAGGPAEEGAKVFKVGDREGPWCGVAIVPVGVLPEDGLCPADRT